MPDGGDRHLADDFLRGERYIKNTDATRRFLDTLPMRDTPRNRCGEAS